MKKVSKNKDIEQFVMLRNINKHLESLDARMEEIEKRELKKEEDKEMSTEEANRWMAG
jgi:hypothetical protein